MTGKERVVASLKGQECDHLCWAPVVDRYFTSSLPAQGYPEVDIPQAIRLMGADIIGRHVPTVRMVEHSSVVRRVDRAGDLERIVYETPIGSLTGERRWAAWHSSHVTKFPITDVDDVKTWQYIAEHTRYEEDFEVFREHERLIGDDGILTSSGPLSPIVYFLEELCGVENTYYLLMDSPEVVESCFQAMHENDKQMYQLLCEGPSLAIFDYEDTSSTIISPLLYGKYCAPYLDDYAAICHDAGKLYITHMCGKLSAFNDQIRLGQMDGVDSVCPPTSGDLWAHEARQAWGDEKIILGGLEPAALVRMSASETCAYATRVLDEISTFRGFILSTGDATAHGTPLENLRTIAEVVAAHPWK